MALSDVKKMQTIDDYATTVYADTDDYLTEITEFYSLVELSNFNRNSFSVQMMIFSEDITDFNALTPDKKTSLIQKLMDQLEVTNKLLRLNAARTILYIAQGCWSDEINIEAQIDRSEQYIWLLYKLGTFSAFIDLLNIEMESSEYDGLTCRKNTADFYFMYVILDVLYLMLEVFRKYKVEGKITESELECLINDLISTDGNCLLIKCLDMTCDFATMKKRKYPIKKLLLLIWKILLVVLGGSSEFMERKRRVRTEAGLLNDHYPPNIEDGAKKHKVSDKDVNIFLHECLLKHTNPADVVKDFRNLPHPIQEGINALMKHVYVPLADVQICTPDNIDNGSKTEMIYRAMFPKMPLYVGALLRIFEANTLLNYQNAAINDKINLFGEILPSKTEKILYHAGKGHFERHGELINKAITAILLILMKNLKLNHVYQFEYLSELLVARNCLQLFISFLRNKTYLSKMSENPLNHFPKQAEDIITLFAEEERFSKTDLYYKPSWRNMFTCINILRIINKLVKWKDSRIRILLSLKPLPTIKRYAVNNDVLQLYVLKLLKILSKYLGRSWRNTNFYFMKMIFQKVRFRLIDDWGFGPSNNFHDEMFLRDAVRKFNTNYIPLKEDFECAPTNEVMLPESFKEHYAEWLQREVFDNPFDWDKFLPTNDCMSHIL